MTIAITITSAPRLLAKPYQGWMALGHALDWVNSHIILGAVFVAGAAADRADDATGRA